MIVFPRAKGEGLQPARAGACVLISQVGRVGGVQDRVAGIAVNRGRRAARAKEPGRRLAAPARTIRARRADEKPLAERVEKVGGPLDSPAPPDPGRPRPAEPARLGHPADTVGGPLPETKLHAPA